MRSTFVQALLLSIATGGCEAQNLVYSLAQSTAPAPSARFDGAIAYDPPGKQLFVFGGQDSSTQNDLWSYSLTGSKWSQVAVAGPLPVARFGHTLVFDSARRRLVLFAGQAGQFYSDVWAFDIEAGAWRKLSPDNAGPSSRYGHSAIYDSVRDRMVISHGFTTSGRFDDTWAFEFSTNKWRELTPAGSKPAKRCLHHATYDAAGDQMYLYGGCSSGYGPCPQGDLWVLDLARNQWKELTPRDSPPPRQHYGMAFDSKRGRLELFGGAGSGLLNDTWEFEATSGLWVQGALVTSSPSARQRHEAVYAADAGATYFFGGTTESGLTNELWSLGSAGASIRIDRIANGFSGDSTSVAPGEVVSIFGSGLGPVQGIVTQVDPATGGLPTAVGGVSVSWNGTAAPIFYAQTGQLNIQVPYQIAGASEVTLTVTASGVTSAAASVPVTGTRPGVFPAVWNEDGSMNSAANPAAIGGVVTIYVTGQGVTLPASKTGAVATGNYPEPAAGASVQIGGLDARVQFRGQAPGTVGVMQMNVIVPAGVGSGEKVAIGVRVGGVDAMGGVFLAVK